MIKVSDLKKFEESNLYGTVVVGVGTLISAFFSYLVQFFLGRKLSISDYGSFNALISLSYLAGVPATVLGVSLVKIVSELFVKNDNHQLKYLFKELVAILLLTGFAFFITFFFFRFKISEVLKIYNINSIVLFSALLGLGFISLLIPCYLQGLQKFKKLAIFQIISSFARFTVPAFFVLLGFGLSGVFGGMFLASILSFFIGMAFLSFKVNGSKISRNTEYLKKLIAFSLPVLFVSFFLMSLNNIDIILVKSFFSPDTAGYYSGVVTLGKILLFGAGAVTIVMFPKITALYSRGTNYISELKKLLFLLTVLVLGGVACYFVFPALLTHVFFGKGFEHSIQYLPLFSIFVGLYVFINFFVMFFLAVNKRSVSILLLPGVLLQYLLISVYHETIFQVIWINIFICIITLSLLVIYLYTNVIKCQAELITKS